MTTGTRNFAYTTQYRAEGEPLPEVPLDLPVGPDLDYSWHKYAECYGNDEAFVALSTLPRNVNAKTNAGEPWCSVCPVKAHCLEQGLTEDKLGDYAPMIYGGMAPHQRRKMTPVEKKMHAARLRLEENRLRNREKPQAA